MERDSTKDKILGSAISLFAEKGFHNVSMKDIGDAAGCSKSSITYYFKTKESLWKIAHHSVLVNRSTKMMSRLRIKNIQRQTPSEMFASVVGNYHESLKAEPEATRFLIWSVAENIDSPADYKDVSSMDSVLVDLISGRLDVAKSQGYIHPDIDTHMLVILIANACLAWTFTSDMWANLVGHDGSSKEWDEKFISSVKALIGSVLSSSNDAQSQPVGGKPTTTEKSGAS